MVDWPPPERSWWRWAARNSIAVAAIHEHGVLSTRMPDWQQLVLSWKELAVLPQRWRAALAEWRGIYLISHTGDAKAYVGSAYGGDNILGRCSPTRQPATATTSDLQAATPPPFASRSCSACRPIWKRPT